MACKEYQGSQNKGWKVTASEFLSLLAPTPYQHGSLQFKMWMHLVRS